MIQRYLEMENCHLLNKTEVKIDNIVLKKANLSEIAAHVADILGFNEGDVKVVDYRNDSMTLDVLHACVNPYNIVGKGDQLLSRLGSLPGVCVSKETSVHSNGMLGWIAIDETLGKEALSRSQDMKSQIAKNILKRAIVFSTGGEVIDGHIEDTNTPAIIQFMASEGYKVTAGGTLKDDIFLITAKLREAADNDGYGVIITTGGVGAEDKDHTVEAIRALDSEAATPYICYFEIGTGRHIKDGIRIAVGRHNDTLIIALPGPNDEVKASLRVLVDGLKMRQGRHALAENIATKLRSILRDKMSQHRTHH